jgi:hypothetical protein
MFRDGTVSVTCQDLPLQLNVFLDRVNRFHIRHLIRPHPGRDNMPSDSIIVGPLLEKRRYGVYDPLALVGICTVGVHNYDLVKAGLLGRRLLIDNVSYDL